MRENHFTPLEQLSSGKIIYHGGLEHDRDVGIDEPVLLRLMGLYGFASMQLYIREDQLQPSSSVSIRDGSIITLFKPHYKSGSQNQAIITINNTHIRNRVEAKNKRIINFSNSSTETDEVSLWAGPN
jgi:hypothetical protein